MDTNNRDWVLGNEPVQERLNLRKELAQFRCPLLTVLILRVDPEAFSFFDRSNAARCAEAFSLYYLSLERFLTYISLAARWERSLRWKKGRSLSPRERELSKRYHTLSRYMTLDFYNYLLYARILCDRVISLARSFLDENPRPSFTSFADHKKFFGRLTSPYGRHERYAEYFRGNTPWFDMPLKPVRDKFIVHAGPPHMRFFGYESGSFSDLTMAIAVPVGRLSNGLAAQQLISVSIRRLARDIDDFLRWFADYGLNCLGPSPNTGPQPDDTAIAVPHG
jgi:hypothetical protein